MVTGRRFSVGAWVVIGATVALVVGSLLAWYRLPSEVVLDAGVHRTYTAWSGGFAPTTLLPLAFGLAICVPVALAGLADLHLPERIGGFRCAQLRLVLAVGGLLLLVCEVATRRAYGPVSLARGPGLWLSLLGAVALLVGVVLDQPGEQDAPPAPTTPGTGALDAP